MNTLPLGDILEDLSRVEAVSCWCGWLPWRTTGIWCYRMDRVIVADGGTGCRSRARPGFLAVRRGVVTRVFDGQDASCAGGGRILGVLMGCAMLDYESIPGWLPSPTLAAGLGRVMGWRAMSWKPRAAITHHAHRLNYGFHKQLSCPAETGASSTLPTPTQKRHPAQPAQRGAIRFEPTPHDASCQREGLCE